MPKNYYQYFNINGISYFFADKGALYFNEFNGVTMIYNINTIQNILKNKNSEISDKKVTNYFGPDYLCFTCSSGVKQINEIASCFFETNLYGAILILHKDLYKKLMEM